MLIVTMVAGKFILLPATERGPVCWRRGRLVNKCWPSARDSPTAPRGETLFPFKSEASSRVDEMLLACSAFGATARASVAEWTVGPTAWRRCGQPPRPPRCAEGLRLPRRRHGGPSGRARRRVFAGGTRGASRRSPGPEPPRGPGRLQ